MYFLNPSAFYLLAFLPIVVLLHFLKLRRQRYVVPSVMLWLEAIEDMKANVPFQRLRNSLLLPLQVLFLLVVVGGVARPALRQFGGLAEQSIVIIDTSASMGATDLGKTRLDVAKGEALKLINQLGTDGQMMIIDTSRPLHNIRQAFTSDAEKLRQAIENLSVVHTPPTLKAVFDSVAVYASVPGAQVVQNPDAVGVVFISDNFGALPNSASPVQIRKIGLGNRSENIAIVQFSVTRALTPPNRYQVLVGVQSFADIPKEFQIQLGIEGKSFFADESVVLPPKETTSTLFFLEDDERFYGQVVTARLDIDDDLPVDNVASAILHPPPKWKVLLVSDRNQPPLSAILKTDPHVILNQVQPSDYHGIGGNDILIFDQFVPDPLPEGNIVFFNPIGGLPFMPIQENSQPTQVIGQHPTHEVMRDVSLIDLEVKASVRVQLPLWGIPLIETNQTPLIWLGEQDNQKVVVFGFDPFDLDVSNFATSIPSAPILMSQCLEWLGAATSPIRPDLVKAGEPVRIHLEHISEVERITVQTPDDSVQELQVRDSRIVFTDTTKVGVYTVFVDDEPFGRFAVNLLNPQESDLSPPELGDDPNAAIDPRPVRSNLPEVNREIWGYAAFLALLLLIVEWWVYHQNRGFR
ncbi:hypothetical protein C6502_20960 [Candidatus Poribacteria bacterium]|nr:MAG: hypothetical protein C6502_20960 [Candidatus Poribacteria bacterium]